MKQKCIKLTRVILLLALGLSLFVGCKKDGEEVKKGNMAKESYAEFLTVDVFCAQANYQGLQSGWFAKAVKDRFNMELNIIAPNVAGGGDTLFQTRSAAGNLGDIVMIGAQNGRLEDLIKAELILDITDMVKESDYLSAYTDAFAMIQKSADTGNSIYAIPSSISTLPATTPSEGLELTYGPYLRWDYYTEVGMPKLSTLEDLLPVLKAMQEKFPKSDSGKKTYAISLFKDWDGNMMTLAKQPACFYGYDEVGFLLNRADGSDVQSIIDGDSQYIRALKFFNQAYQMGILDPESAVQNWDTLYNKYMDGAILFAPWPWLGQAAYNTIENKAAGKGFMIAPIDDMQIFSYGATPTGTTYIAAVGSKAQDPQRMVDFIDWLYSPEGIMMSSHQTGGTCGPEGLTWEMVNNRPELTDFGVDALLKGDAIMPEEWGGGTWKDGVSQLNYRATLPIDINPNNGFPYTYTLWDSVLEMNATPLDLSWQETVGALSTKELLQKNNQLIVAPGTDYIPLPEPSEINTLRAQCREIIIENSWKMVFAINNDEFQILLKKMQDTVNELGYLKVIAFDMQAVEELNAAREKAKE